MPDEQKEKISLLATAMIDWVIRNHVPGKSGAYLDIVDNATQTSVAHGQIGHIRTNVAQEKREFAHEKALRVLSHVGHAFSSESANEAEKKYPGATKGNVNTYSLSNFPPPWDQAITLRLAVFMNEVPDADAILGVHDLYPEGEEHYRLLCDAFPTAVSYA